MWPGMNWSVRSDQIGQGVTRYDVIYIHDRYDRLDQFGQVWPDVTRYDQIRPGVTRLTSFDQVCSVVAGVTRHDQMGQVWPDVTGVTRYDQMGQVWPVVTRYTKCDQIRPLVTRCVQLWQELPGVTRWDQTWTDDRSDQVWKVWPDVGSGILMYSSTMCSSLSPQKEA